MQYILKSVGKCEKAGSQITGVERQRAGYFAETNLRTKTDGDEGVRMSSNKFLDRNSQMNL